jgi:hypothetical protein
MTRDRTAERQPIGVQSPEIRAVERGCRRFVSALSALCRRFVAASRHPE